MVEKVRDGMDAAMRHAAAEHGGSVDVTWTLAYVGFSIPDDAPAVQAVGSACMSIGVTPRCYATGGGSDANVFASYGIPALVLGSGMTDVHSTDESLAAVELERLADLLVAMARMAGA